MLGSPLRQPGLMARLCSTPLTCSRVTQHTPGCSTHEVETQFSGIRVSWGRICSPGQFVKSHSRPSGGVENGSTPDPTAGMCRPRRCHSGMMQFSAPASGLKYEIARFPRFRSRFSRTRTLYFPGPPSRLPISRARARGRWKFFGTRS